MAQQPAPYFVPLTGDPEKDDAIRILNAMLSQTLEAGGSDVEHYFLQLKLLIGLLVSSDAVRMMGALDPSIGVAIEGMLIVGPSLEKCLGDRELLPRCKCGTCPNSESNNPTSDVH